jgi:phosphoribosylformylglycinamidine cyclo-ligase
MNCSCNAARVALVKPNKNKTKHTYAAAGVDIDAADRAKQLIRERVRTTFRPEVLTDIGLFAGLFQLSSKYKEPVLVSSVDGVGTKLKLAVALDKHDTVGIDLVNHCINDIFTCGAEPLFFLDYIAMGKLVPQQVESIVSGLAEACAAAGCALIGGETAEMPGVYAVGDYDLAGFIVGVVERGKVINGRTIKAGDAILALPSTGLHTNGYSLVRKIFGTKRTELNRFYPELGSTLGVALMEPHRCYYAALNSSLPRIKGMAHITGGGIPGNLPRIFPKGLAARIDKKSWKVPPIFSLIQKKGKVDEEEMYRVFNMGVGMMVVCAPSDVDKLLAAVPEAWVIGEVEKLRGEERVIIA